MKNQGRGAKWRAFARSLDPAELKELRDYCTLLISQGGGVVASQNVEDTETIVLDAIVQVMQSKGHDIRSRFVLEKSSQYRAFAQKFRPPHYTDRGAQPGSLSDYFKLHSARSKVRQHALITLAVNLLYEYCISLGGTVSAATMMRYAHLMPSIISKAFPGYAESGLLHLVIRPEGE